MTIPSMRAAAQRPQVDAQADDAEEDRRQHAEGHRLQARDRLLAQPRHLVKDDAGDERAEHRVDADPLGRRRAQERRDDDQHQVGVAGLEVLRRDAHRDAQERIQDEDRDEDEDRQVDDRQPQILDAHRRRGSRPPAISDRISQPDGVVDDAGRQDDQADVALGQIQVDQDLGDHRHRRDRHRGREEQAEQHPAARIGQVLGGHEVAEPEAEAERQHHAHHRGDQRRATEVAQQPQVGLEPGQQQQQAHADGAERVEQVELRRVGREDRLERVREVVPEQASAPARSRRSARPPPPGSPSRLAISAPIRATATSSASCTSSKNTAWPDRPGMGVCKRARP